jgi:hypothetical protein
MNLVMILFLAVLAFVLSPGILLTLPPGGDKTTVALFHAVVIAVVYSLTHKLIWKNVSAPKMSDYKVKAAEL